MKCDECRYYWPPHINGDIGECRRHAPCLSLRNQAITTWPPVAPTSWCGEFESTRSSEIWEKHHAAIRQDT